MNRHFKPKDLPSFGRGANIATTPMAGRRTGSQSLMTGITTIGVGGAIPLHTHNCDESVLVLEGSATVEVAEETFNVAANETTFIPADIPHRFVNATHTPLKIFWTYASADATRTLVETGETRRVDAEHQTATV